MSTFSYYIQQYRDMYGDYDYVVRFLYACLYSLQFNTYVTEFFLRFDDGVYGLELEQASLRADISRKKILFNIVNNDNIILGDSETLYQERVKDRLYGTSTSWLFFRRNHPIHTEFIGKLMDEDDE
jgi:hypothetical protein